MTLDIPNTDPILDPAYAEAVSQRYFANQLATARDIASHWSHLLKRCLSTARPDGGVVDLVLIAGFLRNGLKAYDGALVALSAGAVGAAQFAVRVLWEAGLYAEWIITNDADRWARQSYVADLRLEREVNFSAISGTPQSARYVADWRDTFGREPTAVTPDVARQAQERIVQIDATLALDPYRDISGWFDAHRTKRGLPYEPEWYKPGPQAPRSIRDMATQLSRAAEYAHMYAVLSSFTHSTRPRTGFRVIEPNRVVIEPVRSLSEFPDVFQFAAFLAVRFLILYYTRYRAGELDNLRRVYTDWRSHLAVPKVTERSEHMDL